MNFIWYQFHGESWGVLPNFFLVFHSTRLETTSNLSLNHSAAGICRESGQGPSIFAFEVSPNPSKNEVPGSIFTEGLGMMCNVYSCGGPYRGTFTVAEFPTWYITAVEFFSCGYFLKIHVREIRYNFLLQSGRLLSTSQICDGSSLARF